MKRPSAPLAAALAGLSLGLTTAWSAETGRFLPTISELQPLETLEPVRAMPRTALFIALAEARADLAAERPWAAWTTLASYLEAPERAPAQAVLTGARAAAGWGGWREVRSLLRGRDWLDAEAGGEGWWLLGRAEEKGKNWSRAAEAYRRYAALVQGEARGIAEARLGHVLRESGEHGDAAAAFLAASRSTPAVADWLLTLHVEELAAAGQAAAAATAPQTAVAGSAATRVRRARAEAGALVLAGDQAGAAERLGRASALLAEQGAATEAAELAIGRARLIGSAGRLDEARELLRAAAADTAVASATRVKAATLLGEVAPGATAAEQLARAAAFEAGGRSGPAARALRAALEQGAPDHAPTRLRLGRLLFAAGDVDAARTALRAAASALVDPAQIAEAELLAARARYRAGDRKGGIAELREVATRRVGTAAAGSAWFLLGDITSSRDEAIADYRRAASERSSPDAREALFRLADRRRKAGDAAGAIRAWEEYVGRYPQGEQTAELAFSVARLHAKAGRSAQARAMYTAATLADPLSYYAFRAAERLHADPLRSALAEPRPWLGLATDPADAEAALRRLDLLRDGGLAQEWSQEFDAAVRRLDGRPFALLLLAEGVRDRGHPVEAIRLGRQLLEKRGGAWDARLLRVVFPFPYRELLEREAERSRVDPMLLAGLVRQESMFRPAVRSHVGATGLAQIMPATGRWLAPGAGIGNWDDRLLAVPEVSLRMGARYLADLLRRYDGESDLALAGYNAGPGRADRWRRELGHAQDADAFREAIPFDETRGYVKIVLRNAAVYQRLYGDGEARLAE